MIVKFKLRDHTQSCKSSTFTSFKLNKKYSVILASAFSLFATETIVSAAMPEELYRASLRIAEKKVQQKTRKRSRSQNFPLSAILPIFGREYQVGDHWNVAAWQIRPSLMRMTNEEDKLNSEISDGGLFRYEVVKILSSPSKQVILQITQIQNKGFKPIDPKIQYLNLTVDDRLRQNEKTYFLKGQSEGIRVSPDSIHSSISTLELLPLDIPEVITAEKHRPGENSALAQLPDKIKKGLSNLDVKLNLNQSIRYEQEDFFGRPVAAYWDKGNPWPTLIKTPNGISILIQGDL